MLLGACEENRDWRRINWVSECIETQSSDYGPRDRNISEECYETSKKLFPPIK